MMLLPLIFAFQVFVSSVPVADAQGTDAVCLAQYNWMNNSLGQNPCLVTSWLWTPCNGLGNASVVPKLPLGFAYSSPQSKSQATPCMCNTVAYSLLAACGKCQIGNSTAKFIDAWPTYSTNCTKKYNGTYPDPIPNDTAIPKWAFLDVISNSNFDVDAAKSLAAEGLPDVTTESSSTATSSPPSSRIPTSTSQVATRSSIRSQNLTPTTTQTSPAPQQSRRNAGAIAGGVVGGVIGLSLLTLGLYIILRRRQQARGDRNLDDFQTPAVREFSSLEAPNYHVPTLKAEIGLYDPDDPRTYPPPRGSGTYPPSQGSATGYAGLPQVMT